MLFSNGIYIVSLIFIHHWPKTWTAQDRKMKCVACHKNLGDINLPLESIIQARSNPSHIVNTQTTFLHLFHKGKHEKPWERFSHAKPKRMCYQEISREWIVIVLLNLYVLVSIACPQNSCTFGMYKLVCFCFFPLSWSFVLS